MQSNILYVSHPRLIVIDLICKLCSSFFLILFLIRLLLSENGQDRRKMQFQQIYGNVTFVRPFCA